MRCVKLTLPPRERARWLLSMSSLAGTARTLVAVGTVSETSMLATTREGAPRRGVTMSSLTGPVPLTAGMSRGFGVSPLGSAFGSAGLAVGAALASAAFAAGPALASGAFAVLARVAAGDPLVEPFAVPAPAPALVVCGRVAVAVAVRLGAALVSASPGR